MKTVNHFVGKCAALINQMLSTPYREVKRNFQLSVNFGGTEACRHKAASTTLQSQSTRLLLPSIISLEGVQSRPYHECIFPELENELRATYAHFLTMLSTQQLPFQVSSCNIQKVPKGKDSLSLFCYFFSPWNFNKQVLDDFFYRPFFLLTCLLSLSF